MAKTPNKASRKVAQVMHEFKEGDLKSGGSGRKVTNPKQAIAIGLSEARRQGADVPPPKKATKKATKKAAKKSAPKKGAKKSARKSPPKSSK